MSRMDGEFSYLLEKQKEAHCGACSLSYCLYVLGTERTQRQIAYDTGMPWRIYLKGLKPSKIMKAASANGARCREIKSESSEKFMDKLDRHLAKGNPAVLLVEDYSHWVAVLGTVKDKGKVKYVVDDPVDKDKFFFLMSRDEFLDYAWNDEDDEGNECIPYYALLVSRKDGRPAAWRPAPVFLRLCEEGSYSTAKEMVDDLREIVKNCGGASRKRLMLGDVLRSEMEAVRKSLKWIDWGSAEADEKEMMEFFEDYAVVADAAGIECPENINRTELMSQITALLVTCAWWGEL